MSVYMNPTGFCRPTVSAPGYDASVNRRVRRGFHLVKMHFSGGKKPVPSPGHQHHQRSTTTGTHDFRDKSIPVSIPIAPVCPQLCGMKSAQWAYESEKR